MKGSSCHHSVASSSKGGSTPAGRRTSSETTTATRSSRSRSRSSKKSMDSSPSVVISAQSTTNRHRGGSNVLPSSKSASRRTSRARNNPPSPARSCPATHPTKSDNNKNKLLLLQAVQKGETNIVSQLLDSKRVDVNSVLVENDVDTGERTTVIVDDQNTQRRVIKTNGWTALHFAAYLGHFEMTALLLTQGADRFVHDAQGQSPLHMASRLNHIHIAWLLADDQEDHGNNNVDRHDEDDKHSQRQIANTDTNTKRRGKNVDLMLQAHPGTMFMHLYCLDKTLALQKDEMARVAKQLQASRDKLQLQHLQYVSYTLDEIERMDGTIKKLFHQQQAKFFQSQQAQISDIESHIDSWIRLHQQQQQQQKQDENENTCDSIISCTKVPPPAMQVDESSLIGNHHDDDADINEVEEENDELQRLLAENKALKERLAALSFKKKQSSSSSISLQPETQNTVELAFATKAAAMTVILSSPNTSRKNASAAEVSLSSCSGSKSIGNHSSCSSDNNKYMEKFATALRDTPSTTVVAKNALLDNKQSDVAAEARAAQSTHHDSPIIQQWQHKQHYDEKQDCGDESATNTTTTTATSNTTSGNYNSVKNYSMVNRHRSSDQPCRLGKSVTSPTRRSVANSTPTTPTSTAAATDSNHGPVLYFL